VGRSCGALVPMKASLPASQSLPPPSNEPLLAQEQPRSDEGTGPLGNSYTCSFAIPFKRTDVFKELINSKAPLGISLTKLKLTVMKSWNSSVELDEYEVGCIRQVDFMEPKGITISELVAMEPGYLLRWMELENSVQTMRMVGRGQNKPLFTVTLADSPRGTVATLRYDFHQVEVPGMCCGSRMRSSFPPNISNNLATMLKNAWSTDMNARGYQQIATDDVSLGDGFETSFTIPFLRADVFKELTRFNNPLGADNSELTFNSNGSSMAADATVSLGTKRTAVYQRQELMGQTVSECVDFIPGTFIKWRQLETSKRGMQLVGDGAKKPEFAISLLDNALGTTVHLKYDYAKIEAGGEMGSSARIKQFFDQTAADTWTKDMVGRGYQKGVTTPRGSNLVNLGRDQAEEAAIRAGAQGMQKKPGY